MNKYFGYGTDLSGIRFKGLKNFIKEYSPEILEEMDEDIFKIDSSSDKDLEWWINGYFEYNGFSGMAAYLAMIINRHENLEFSCSDENGDYVFVPALYPWQFNDEMHRLTPDKVKEILTKWISRITDDSIKVNDIVLYCELMDE